MKRLLMLGLMIGSLCAQDWPFHLVRENGKVFAVLNEDSSCKVQITDKRLYILGQAVNASGGKKAPVIKDIRNNSGALSKVGQKLQELKLQKTLDQRCSVTPEIPQTPTTGDLQANSQTDTTGSISSTPTDSTVSSENNVGTPQEPMMPEDNSVNDIQTSTNPTDSTTGDLQANSQTDTTGSMSSASKDSTVSSENNVTTGQEPMMPENNSVNDIQTSTNTADSTTAVGDDDDEIEKMFATGDPDGENEIMFADERPKTTESTTATKQAPDTTSANQQQSTENSSQPQDTPSENTPKASENTSTNKQQETSKKSIWSRITDTIQAEKDFLCDKYNQRPKTTIIAGLTGAGLVGGATYWVTNRYCGDWFNKNKGTKALQVALIGFTALSGGIGAIHLTHAAFDRFNA